tara:strand:- start:1650 stop:2390 length:741 start_codon:yes stop_codon:yes gene_type:complete
MNWMDEGIVIGAKRHGERQIITTLLTKGHGRHKGIFRPSKATKSTCECGTVVQATWSARLREHLGSWALEPLYSPLAFVLHNPLALKALNSACILLEVCLPEREAAPKVYTAFRHLIHDFENLSKNDSSFLKAYCYFELFLLEHAGIPLDFKTCAVTGEQDNLYYVSPRTGRAVSREVGEPYKDKLLLLPAFLQGSDKQQKELDPQEILAALALSGYFLNKYVFVPHDINPPEARHRLLASLENIR